jgi:hypothetical protein
MKCGSANCFYQQQKKPRERRKGLHDFEPKNLEVITLLCKETMHKPTNVHAKHSVPFSSILSIFCSHIASHHMTSYACIQVREVRERRRAVAQGQRPV